MARIINMTFRNTGLDEEQWEFSVVRDDNYQEITMKDLDGIQDIIDGLLQFAQTVRTKESIQLEESQREKEEILSIVTNTFTDEQKIENLKLYPLWKEFGKYSKNQKVPYVVYPDYETGHLYKIIGEEFESQSAWNPKVAVSLFAQVGLENEILPFGKNPDGSDRVLSVNPYMTNERCIFDGYVWCSIIDNNVWSPTDYPQGWEKENAV